MKMNKTKQIELTKKRVSTSWNIYMSKKEKILNSTRLNSETKQRKIKEIYNKTNIEISEKWSNYRHKIHPEKSFNLKLEREYRIKSGYEKHYKLKNIDQLNKTVKQLKKDFRYLLISFEFLNVDTDVKILVSDSFTPERLEDIENIYNTILEKFTNNDIKSDISNYQLINIFIRKIYAHTPKGKTTKKFRKYRK